jgi:hypothetical protein
MATTVKYETVALSIAAIYFIIKILIYVPMFVYEVRLIKKSNS